LVSRLLRNTARRAFSIIIGSGVLASAIATSIVMSQTHEEAMGTPESGRRLSIEEVKSKHELDLLKVEGVQGVGIGLNERGDQRVIKVYVDQTRDKPPQRIPA